MINPPFTSGPWSAFGASWNDEGDVRYTLLGVKEAKRADALLISAAPDMYAALYLASLHENNPDVLAAIDAALAKARGETP
jgi:hypothetical protein